MAPSFRNVLVVDDSEGVRKTVARIVERAGYRAVCAASGAEAIEIARGTEFAAVIVDYHMPGLDGLQVLAQLRSIQPAAARLMLSGALDLDVVLSALNRGEASRVLAKPIAAGALTTALRQAIESREAAGRRWVATRDGAMQAQRDGLKEVLDGGFDMALQPIADSRTRKTVAFEALLRPHAGALRGPEEVLNAAEVTGCISVLGGVIAQKLAHKLERLPETTQLFVNLHPLELAEPSALLEAYAPLAPYAERVVLEVTERGALPKEVPWRESIEAVRELGFQIAIDDLGSGAASLAALAEIDPDIIKLDMSLVQGLDKSERKRRLVQMLCRFGSAVGVEVVAEGLETEGEVLAAEELGIDLLQGYWLGRPDVNLDVALAALDAEQLPLAKVSAPANTGTQVKAEVLVVLAEQRKTQG